MKSLAKLLILGCLIVVARFDMLVPPKDIETCITAPQKIVEIYTGDFKAKPKRNIGFRAIVAHKPKPPKITDKRNHVFVFEDNAPNKLNYVDDLYDHYSNDYGPPLTGTYIKTPWKLIAKFHKAKSVSDLINLYQKFYQKSLIFSPYELEKYISLVRNPEPNNSWYDYEYFLFSSNQVDYEVGRVIRSVIDPDIPQRTIDTISLRIKECKFGGLIARFRTPRPRLKVIYSVSFKVLFISCHQPKNIQILAFHAKKTGFYRHPETSRLEKRTVYKSAHQWLQTFFINMFAAPAVIEDLPN